LRPKDQSPKEGVFKLSTIKDEPFIKIKNLKTNQAQNNLDEVLAREGIRVNWIAETETIQVAKAMVEKGSGYSIIDDFSAKIYGESISIREIEPSIGYEICMISNKEKPLSVNAKSFISFLEGVASDSN
jgi:DNA-binding transcriptional LysR family regulator